MIAALFVQKNGSYFGLPDVDPWDVARDARKYAGPHTVVAHPPCSRWCRFAGLVEARWGHKRGDDGGCFESALKSVRTWGGVLEHPAYTDAFGAFGIGSPPRGHWQKNICGGWTTEVSQAAYGHRARKDTWLYVFGTIPPGLDWAITEGDSVVSSCTRRGDGTFFRGTKRKLGAKEASKTPEAFRDLLIAIARSAEEARRE
jgi:hypothetical protein